VQGGICAEKHLHAATRGAAKSFWGGAVVVGAKRGRTSRLSRTMGILEDA
jgi:hypothetical protein